jgi:hypothetical protein
MAGIRFASVIFLALEPRVALVLFVLLLAAAAAPIFFGWLALLPSEREPFALPGESSSKQPRDPFAIFLLANISVGLLLRIPGAHAEWLSSQVTRLLPPDWAENTIMIATIWFGFIPGLAAAYSAVRANPIRWQLLVGGVLTLILWLVGPWLLNAISNVA